MYRILAILILTLCLAGPIGSVAGCKPAQEPARYPNPEKVEKRTIEGIGDPGKRGVGRPTGTVLIDPADAPNAAREVPAVPPTIAPAPDVAGADPGDTAAQTSDTTSDHDAADTTAGEADTAGSIGSDEVVASVTLPEAVIARVQQAPSASQERRARDLNRAGLRKHRRFDLEAAISNYQAALEAWPGHPFSNYNLACAYALTDRSDDALRHLAIVSIIGGADGRERLHKARVDKDFDSLHGDLRFRELTGYIPVQISWSPSKDEGAKASRLAAALVSQTVPAKVRGPWRDDAARNSLLVRNGDRLAASMAAEVMRGVALDDLVLVQRDDLGDANPVVLVLAGAPELAPSPTRPDPVDPVDPTPDVPGAAAPDHDGPDRPVARLDAPEGEATPMDPSAFEGFVGRQLTARDGDTVQRLRLKASGFFRWEHAKPSGARTVKTGRYALRDGRLELTFKAVSETPGADPTAPEITIKEGQRSVHQLGTLDGALVLDGTAFSVR